MVGSRALIVHFNHQEQRTGRDKKHLGDSNSDLTGQKGGKRSFIGGTGVAVFMSTISKRKEKLKDPMIYHESVRKNVERAVEQN